jgi:endonuclease YncB( thermonuclease family)
MTVWTVPAQIVRVIDADTLVVNLDQGWRTWRLNERVRLLGCNAPELSTPAGREAKQFAERLLCDENGDYRPITVVSHSLDKYGRVLGSVHWSGVSFPYDLASELLTAGHAVPA